STPNAQPPGQPQAKKAPAAAASGAPYGGMKDGPAAPLRPLYDVWAEGYADYDEHSGPSVRYTSYGILSGVDHTYLQNPREGFLIGGLAGYNETKGKLGTGAAPTDPERRSQDIQGAMLGLYGTYFHRGFAIDVVAKTDLFDFDQRGLDC